VYIVHFSDDGEEFDYKVCWGLKYITIFCFLFSKLVVWTFHEIHLYPHTSEHGLHDKETERRSEIRPQHVQHNVSFVIASAGSLGLSRRIIYHIYQLAN
jgi:hypothetical protein